MQFISNSESLLNNESSLDASVTIIGESSMSILPGYGSPIKKSLYHLHHLWHLDFIGFFEYSHHQELIGKIHCSRRGFRDIFISSLIAIIYGFRCIQPNIHMKFPPSIVFLGIFSNFKSPVEYHDHSKEIIVHIEKMQQELCNQIYINSIIAHKKYNDLKNRLLPFWSALISLLMIVINFYNEVKIICPGQPKFKSCNNYKRQQL